MHTGIYFRNKNVGSVLLVQYFISGMSIPVLLAMLQEYFDIFTYLAFCFLKLMTVSKIVLRLLNTCQFLKT